jgi:phage protein D
MLRPAYKLTVGGKVVDTTDEPQASTLVDLKVTLDLDTPADSFAMVLGNVGGLKPSRDDQARVELGYADNGGVELVLTGKVVSVEPNLSTTRVVGFSGADALLRTYVEQTYEGQTAGQIVRDLAGRAGLPVESAQDGALLPAYVVDGRRSVYLHMQELAALVGCDLYVNSEGKLVFEQFFSGKRVHLFEFAKHVLELDVQRTPPVAGLVEAWGEGPTRAKGNRAWAWLTTDFGGSKGTAGSGALLLVERPALRTAAAARTAAEAALKNIRRRTIRGRVLSTGRPEVRLGDAVRFEGLPDETLNTSFQVRGVTHRITKPGGFTTAVGFRAIQTDA